MSTQYHVYKNNGLGGPVDYGTVISTTASLTYSPAALTYPSDTTFAVRAFDTVSGFEDLNVDAVTRIVLNASGVDITNLPAPPSHVSARATASGGARIEWTHNAGGQVKPTQFKVWLTVGGTVNYAASPATTITYFSGTAVFKADLTGLVNGTAYSVGVRSVNVTGTETNTTAIASLTGKTTAPSEVDSLTATTTYSA